MESSLEFRYRNGKVDKVLVNYFHENGNPMSTMYLTPGDWEKISETANYLGIKISPEKMPNLETMRLVTKTAWS